MVPPALLVVRKCRRDHVGFSFFLCRSRISKVTLSRDGTHDAILPMVFAAPTGGANLLSLGLRSLDMPVACGRVRLPCGAIERREGSSSVPSPAHASRPPYSYCKQEAS